MSGRIKRKWRPPLALVISAVLGLVLALPLLGILTYRQAAPLIGGWLAGGLIFGAVLAITLALAAMLARVLLRPVRALAARAEAVTRGTAEAAEPLAHYGTAEMERMGRAVLEMGRVLQGREAVLRSYADHATHELKSPLTVLRGAAELLDGDDLPREERQRLLLRIDEAADRMTALLDAQRLLARAQEPLAPGECALRPLMAALRLEHPEVEIVLEADAVLPLAEAGLRLVLDHLVGNAAANGAGEVRLRAGPEGLSVADNGRGISPGNRDRIFDPFFTTRREAGGTGMGLPIVRRMLRAHGGDIALAAGEGPGARFVITF